MVFMNYLVNYFFVATAETESVKKLYVKIADAYGSLGILTLAAGRCQTMCNSYCIY